jgi:hypothetical protein
MSVGAQRLRSCLYTLVKCAFDVESIALCIGWP